MQDNNSFAGDTYGGMQLIAVNQANRLLHVNLTSFICHVDVTDFGVIHPKSGVKPSKNVNLGCLWSLPNAGYGKQAIWKTDGSIVILGRLSNGDRCIHTPATLPIPDGVTFA